MSQMTPSSVVMSQVTPTSVIQETPTYVVRSQESTTTSIVRTQKTPIFAVSSQDTPTSLVKSQETPQSILMSQKKSVSSSKRTVYLNWLNMVVLACCIVPSYPGILDLDDPRIPDSADNLHIAAKYLGDHVTELNPDLLVLISHRSPRIPDQIALHLGSTAVGSSCLHAHWQQFKVSGNIGIEETKELHEMLENKGKKVCLIEPGDCGTTLGWAETTSLWFLGETRGTSGTRSRTIHQDMLIISPPGPREAPNEETPDFLDYCVSIGEDIADILDDMTEKIVIIVPGDLSQEHLPHGDFPEFKPPGNIKHDISRVDKELRKPNFRKAEAFDDTIEHWVRTIHRAELVDRAPDILYTPALLSLSILQGIVERCGLAGEVLARAAPSYLGQLAALFHPQDKGWRVLGRPLPKKV
ncbi:uncharacterized protein LOC111712576 [Eurytemora carolleeae]|uniref:uncharacterized protein LOC111712576 n=1 Tax=Eurytemora carolleeae TaxID=1294199 RepID=UPI000C76E9A7|nr:uncharacterized protein LOC111712576 [Eurytemora carolleeae]|eukprot:XP_023342998.1 uncharacterized protein LOC111712576 [Eurytemora affinis]